MTPTDFRSLLRLLLPIASLTVSAHAVAPLPPQVNSVTWTAANSFTINWQDRSTDETGFVIAYRTNPNSNFSILGEIAANSTTSTRTLDVSFRVCDLVFEWTVASFKGSGAAREYSTILNTIQALPPPPVGQTSCPPIFRTANYTSSMLNAAFSFQTTAVKRNTTNGALVNITTGYSVSGGTGLPPGLAINSAGLITGTPTTLGRYSFTLKVQETGGLAATLPMKINIFQPVPALVPPANGTALTDRTLHRGAAATILDLGAHFSDPDVTDATRFVFNTGTIDFLYYPTVAPVTVANFKGYVSRGDFLNTIIHRSIPGFVIQGGGFKAEAGTPSIPRQPGPVTNEPSITNARGTVAMAKTGGNPDSATSEFFVNLADNNNPINPDNLNNQNEGFTVFARVPLSSMAVVDSIAALTTRDYQGINPALPNCPVTNPPPPSFSPASLVKVQSALSVAPLSYTVQSSAPGVCGVSVNGGQLSLTALTAGTATITVTATDLDNQSINGTFNVIVDERLSDWLTAQNFPIPGDAAPAADPDKDSVPNIVEFALMTNPQSGNPVPSPLPGITTAGADKFLNLTFPVRKLAGSGFLYAVESQNMLTGEWTQIWKSTDGFMHAQVVSSTDQPDRTDVTIRDTAAITAGGRQFLRLRVTETP